MKKRPWLILSLAVVLFFFIQGNGWQSISIQETAAWPSAPKIKKPKVKVKLPAPSAPAPETSAPEAQETPEATEATEEASSEPKGALTKKGTYIAKKIDEALGIIHDPATETLLKDGNDPQTLKQIVKRCNGAVSMFKRIMKYKFGDPGRHAEYQLKVNELTQWISKADKELQKAKRGQARTKGACYKVSRDLTGYSKLFAAVKLAFPEVPKPTGQYALNTHGGFFIDSKDNFEKFKTNVADAQKVCGAEPLASAPNTCGAFIEKVCVVAGDSSKYIPQILDELIRLQVEKDMKSITSRFDVEKLNKNSGLKGHHVDQWSDIALEKVFPNINFVTRINEKISRFMKSAGTGRTFSKEVIAPFHAEIEKYKKALKHWASNIKLPERGAKTYGCNLLKKQANSIERGATMKTCSTNGGDWRIKKNGVGAILKRCRDGWGVFKLKSDPLCQYHHFTLCEEYTGGGRYQKVKTLSQFRDYFKAFVTCKTK